MKFYRAASLLVFILLFIAHSGVSQVDSTYNNYTGSWESAGSWVTGQPDPLHTGINDEIDVYGYITRNGSLSFASIGANNKYITIYDTLVVMGNISFADNSLNLKIASGGLLVVFGDFTSNNKVTLDNGGILVVTEDLVLNGGQNDYKDNGGSLYVDGTISGNGDTPDANTDSDSTSALGSSSDSGEQQLYTFINGGGETPLPIKLSYFRSVLQAHHQVVLNWETLTEENFDYFEVQHSSTGGTFEGIGIVKGNGFTSDPHQYSFAHEAPAYGFNFYRLRAVDYDGASEIFWVIKVEVMPNFEDVRLYPNPNSGLSFRLDIPGDLLKNTSSFSLTISDLKGRIFMKEEIGNSDTSHSFETHFTSGIYIVSLTSGAYIHSMRLVVR